MSKSRPDNGNGNDAKNNHEIVAKPDTLNLIELKKKDINSLIKIAREYNIENANSMRGQELLFALLQAHKAQRYHLWSRCSGSTARRFWIPPRTGL